MTRVLFDARELSGDSSWSGVGTAIRGLLTSIAAEPGLQVRALATPEVELPAGVERGTLLRLARNGRRRSVVEHQLLLPIDLARFRADVFHNPHLHAPWRTGRPTVQTLYDVIPLVFPDPSQEVLRKRWLRYIPRYRRADAVAAISRHAADDGIRHLGLDPRRVEVVPLGIDPAFHPATERTDGEPYVLVVSEYSLRKGFPDAIAVIADLAEAGFPHRLKVAGRIPAHNAHELHELVRRADRPDRIDLLGYVPDVTAVYRDADLVLVPSRYEGFGLPALEAMASGVPVIAYDNSSLPEVIGPGGMVVPDGDVAALAAAARALLGQPTLAAEQRERGLRRAADFSWANTAAAYADLYRGVATR